MNTTTSWLLGKSIMANGGCREEQEIPVLCLQKLVITKLLTPRPYFLKPIFCIHQSFSFFVIFFCFFNTLMLSLLFQWQRIRVLSPHNPPRVKESSLATNFQTREKSVGCFSSDSNNPLQNVRLFRSWKTLRRRSTVIWKLFVSSQADGGCQ